MAKEAKEECKRLLTGALSIQDSTNNPSFFQNLTKLLLSGSEYQVANLCAFLKDVIDGSEQSPESNSWTNLPSFLQFLSWCICNSQSGSSLETFLINTLLRKIIPLSTETKKGLNPILKQTLQK